jgi:hypothetical protein
VNVQGTSTAALPSYELPAWRFEGNFDLSRNMDDYDAEYVRFFVQSDSSQCDLDLRIEDGNTVFDFTELDEPQWTPLLTRTDLKWTATGSCPSGERPFSFPAVEGLSYVLHPGIALDGYDRVVIRSGASPLSIDGDLASYNLDPEIPYGEFEVHLDAGGYLMPPNATSLACGDSDTLARYIRDEVCQPSRAFVSSDSPLAVWAISDGTETVFTASRELILGGVVDVVGVAPRARCRVERHRRLCVRDPLTSELQPSPECSLDAVDQRDFDMDGLQNFVESCYTRTDTGADDSACGPEEGRDTDGDGFSDGWEVCGTDLLDSDLFAGPLCRDILHSFVSPEPTVNEERACSRYRSNVATAVEVNRLDVERLGRAVVRCERTSPYDDLEENPDIRHTFEYWPRWEYRGGNCANSADACVYVNWRPGGASTIATNTCTSSLPSGSEGRDSLCEDSYTNPASAAREPTLIRIGARLSHNPDTDECTCVFEPSGAHPSRIPCDNPATVSDPETHVSIAEAPGRCEDRSICSHLILPPDRFVCDFSTPQESVDFYAVYNGPEQPGLVRVDGALVQHSIHFGEDVLGAIRAKLWPPLVRYTVHAHGGMPSARTIVHESGHLLGLVHGPFISASDGTLSHAGNYNPWYDSVMNYSSDGWLESSDGAGPLFLLFSPGWRAATSEYDIASEVDLGGASMLPMGRRYIDSFENEPGWYRGGTCDSNLDCAAGEACHLADPWEGLARPSGTSLLKGYCYPESDGLDLDRDGFSDVVLTWIDGWNSDAARSGWNVDLDCTYSVPERSWQLKTLGACGNENPSGEPVYVNVPAEYCFNTDAYLDAPPCTTDDDCAGDATCRDFSDVCADVEDAPLRWNCGSVTGRCLDEDAREMRVQAAWPGARIEVGESYVQVDVPRISEPSEYDCHSMPRNRVTLAYRDEIPPAQSSDFERMRFPAVQGDLCGLWPCECELPAAPRFEYDPPIFSVQPTPFHGELE